MGLYQCRPPMSGRMGVLWTLASIRDAALIEYGCMGHMMYGRVFLNRAGVTGGCKLYSTHLNETDISLGNLQRLNRTVKHVIEKDQVKTVFLLPSSVPNVTGIDLEAACEELRLQYSGINLLAFGAGGFDVYGSRGVEEALLHLTKNLTKPCEVDKKPHFNLIGSCADLFRFQADKAELVRILKGALNMDATCIMTSDTTVDEIQRMAGAQINLVIRAEGEAAAKYLQKTYGTPYLLARPYGIEEVTKWVERIAEICKLQVNQAFIREEERKTREQIEPSRQIFQHITRMHPECARLSLGGHPDVVKGILSFGMNEFSFSKGECWSTLPNVTDCEIPYYSEEKWMEAVKNHKKGYLMTSGEALALAGRSLDMQIANPDVKWRIHPYDPPLVGYRGAAQLVNLWLNEDPEK